MKIWKIVIGMKIVIGIMLAVLMILIGYSLGFIEKTNLEIKLNNLQIENESLKDKYWKNFKNCTPIPHYKIYIEEDNQ